ncbi:hypothetical protein C8R43DRAFT_1241852 [Mycena crocata]|nr:hypothetical protein C8R43DRAFT_1241852 [Mycena crocata]
MDVAVPTETPLPVCNACHKAPVTNDAYSTCRPCREKRSERDRKSRERRRQAKMVLKAAQSVNIPLTEAEESSSTGKKRKMAPVDDESAADAMDRMRKRFKGIEPFTKTEHASKPTPIADPALDPVDPVFEKCINAGDLHTHVKRLYRNKSRPVRFYGTFAIIAFPDIDNKMRVRHVARDLRDNTDLHFNPEDKKSKRSSDSAQTYTISYKCTCRTNTTSPELAAHSESKDTAPASGEKPKRKCRGRIEISAEDDRSHPLGWLGQRVKVTVTHPKRV